MTEYPPVPADLRERLSAARDVGGRGVGEVFSGSHLRDSCPDCGNTLVFSRVHYTVEGDRDVPLAQQETHEVAHEYVCHDHDEQWRWLVDVENGTQWYLAGVGDG